MKNTAHQLSNTDSLSGSADFIFITGMIVKIYIYER